MPMMIISSGMDLKLSEKRLNWVAYSAGGLGNTAYIIPEHIDLRTSYICKII